MPVRCEKRVASAEVEKNDCLSLGVLFVVAEAGLDEQLFSNEPSRGVAALADIAGWAQASHGRRNRRGVIGNEAGDTGKGMRSDFNELLGSIHLGAQIGGSTGADVAIGAGHVRVSRYFVGGVLGMHHMAALTAELRRIHIRCAAIAGRSDDEQIDDGGYDHDVNAVAENGIVEIDLGKDGRNRFRLC